MNAGELRHRVRIEKPTEAENEYGYGAQAPGWTDEATVSAFVRPVRAGEMIRAGQPAMETTYVVRMRYTPLVTADDRLVWIDPPRDDQPLYISSVIDVDGRHVELEIICTEREAPANG